MSYGTSHIFIGVCVGGGGGGGGEGEGVFSGGGSRKILLCKGRGVTT